jgi:nucleoside-diphosphate-sugar epimerase
LKTTLAIVGATSIIAQDFILNVFDERRFDLVLYAREPETVHEWLRKHDYVSNVAVAEYSTYGEVEHDVVVNFVGVGDPARTAAMGASILKVTHDCDQMILSKLGSNPLRKYIFLSSGAVYGANFKRAASEHSGSVIKINDLLPQDYYSVAKLYAECWPRSLAELNIVDVRIFNYFSCHVSIEARFFISDILRSIRSDSLLEVTSEPMVRDFIHPIDFYSLVCRIIDAPGSNLPLDCYSRQPISKEGILCCFEREFGLRYRITVDPGNSPNATGLKANYYSEYRVAEGIGFEPKYSSLETLVEQTKLILSSNAWE